MKIQYKNIYGSGDKAMNTLTFGKHKGQDIKDVPLKYLEWGSNKLQSIKWKKQFNTDIQRRQAEDDAKEAFILENIDSQEVWDLLVMESASELYEKDYRSQCVSIQCEIRKIAERKLLMYEKKAIKLKADVGLCGLNTEDDQEPIYNQLMLFN